MKKKLLSLSIVAVLLLSCLTACGSKDGGSDAGTSDSDKDAGKKYQVGICQLVQHPALDQATKGFRDALTDKLGDQVDIDEQNAAGDSATCSTICNTFVTSGKDLIMANATPALVAATQATDSIPIIGTSITDYATALQIDNWKGVTGMNVTGTSDLAPLEDQAKMIGELFPDAKKVGILYCSAEPNSVYQSEVVTKALEEMGMEVKEYTFADTNDVSSVTTTACDDSDVIYIPTDNTAASCTEAINSVASDKKVPIIAGEENICAGCGVATLSISYYDIGYRAGEMAYEILVNGADASTMEIEFSSEFTKEYNADICDKLGVEVKDDYVAIESAE